MEASLIVRITRPKEEGAKPVEASAGARDCSRVMPLLLVS